MTENADTLTNIIYKDGGTVIFGDNSKGYVIGQGDVASVGTSKSPLITNVILVKNLKHNLLSISKLCDKGFLITFETGKCNIFDKNKNLIFEGTRNHNIYVLNMKIRYDKNLCLMADTSDPWIWHKRLCHVNFRNLHKLAKNKLVHGLPNINFKVNNLCDACQKGNALGIASARRAVEFHNTPSNEIPWSLSD